MKEEKNREADWRYQNGDYLRNLVFEYTAYKPTGPNDDHDHCAFCWVKFYSEKLGDDTQTEGYVAVTEEEYSPELHDIRKNADGSMAVPKAVRVGNKAYTAHWVCKECFAEFKVSLNLRVKRTTIENQKS